MKAVRRVTVLLAAACLTLSTVSPAAAFDVQDVTTARLVAERAALDGAVVQITGEVVSEPLRGGAGHVWLNVLGPDGIAIGVWLPERLAEPVESFGRYGWVGDTVTVTGTFSRACDRHGGDLDIHADSLVVVRPGEARSHPVAPWKAVVGVVGLLIAGLGWGRLRHAREEAGA